MTAPRRKHFRHQTAVRAKVRPRGSFAWLTCKVHNLSRGGILIELGLSSLVLVGDHLEIEFETVDRSGKPNQRRLNGKAVWRRGVRYGVEFSKEKRKA